MYKRKSTVGNIHLKMKIFLVFLIGLGLGSNRWRLYETDGQRSVGRNGSSLVLVHSQASFNQRIEPHKPEKVELKEGRAKNTSKTTILKPGEIFDLASFNRYRYRNIFNVRYSQIVVANRSRWKKALSNSC